MNIRFDVTQVTQAIEALQAQFPELADDEALRADMFEAETDLHAVIEKLLSISRDAETMCAAIAERRQDLLNRLARYEAREEGARSIIQKLMEKADLQKVTLPEATLSVSFRKPAPIVVDEAALPDEFCKFKRSPDMAKIREAPELPPGCSMSNGKNVLTVRTK